MTSIGVRELRQHASRWLARVKAGERIVVTERGRPIAELVPIVEPPPGGRLAQLVEEGLASPGAGSLLDVLDRVGGPTIGPAVSPRLEELRSGER
ncbi:MAG: type II toxin-antitoxin system prevent-host-death family antitoxin [Acidimicrobiia bacterium]|nr:type II toxin-antitoxin system prevent-host-death family antitoxin [Acidimicrobiia bacterium]